MLLSRIPTFVIILLSLLDVPYVPYVQPCRETRRIDASLLQTYFILSGVIRNTLLSIRRSSYKDNRKREREREKPTVRALYHSVENILEIEPIFFISFYIQSVDVTISKKIRATRRNISDIVFETKSYFVEFNKKKEK